MSKQEALLRSMRAHLATLDEKERLVYAARLLWRSPYTWGGETIAGTDCSGSIFFSLYLLGYNVRTTAHELYTSMTLPLSRAPEAGDLAFWFHPGKDKVRHVAWFSDKMVILDADKKFMDVPIGQEIQERYNQRFEARQLDMDQVLRYSKEGSKAYGVSGELANLKGVFNLEDTWQT